MTPKALLVAIIMEFCLATRSPRLLSRLLSRYAESGSQPKMISGQRTAFLLLTVRQVSFERFCAYVAEQSCDGIPSKGKKRPRYVKYWRGLLRVSECQGDTGSDCSTANAPACYERQYRQQCCATCSTLHTGVTGIRLNFTLCNFVSAQQRFHRFVTSQAYRRCTFCRIEELRAIN